MSRPIISVENLGKCYTIRHEGGGPRYRRLSEELSSALARPFRGLWKQRSEVGGQRSDVRSQKLNTNGQTPSPPTSDLRSLTSESFWALRDVSFEVQEGEVLGIIGRNGAGKSTLLKVLSRITEPSAGRVTLRGRVASLLEVGTGFHPELTGRENVYLNGAILGMSRAEIRRKFDEIVAFAEVERFLDTPVKHYSSGMYVRLAFAVAAHLEPEILIVDEVLAVGDAQFQKKCLGKMQDVSSHGRTVLFVSHNMPAVLRLCSSVCWLSEGSISERGETNKVARSYLAQQTTSCNQWTRPYGDKPFSRPYIERIVVGTSRDNGHSQISAEDEISVELRVQNPSRDLPCQVAARVSTADGQPIFTTTSTDCSRELTRLCYGASTFSFSINRDLLAPGDYSMIFAILIPGGQLLDVVADKIAFQVGTSLNHATRFRDGRLGLVTPLFNWNCTR